MWKQNTHSDCICWYGKMIREKNPAHPTIELKCPGIHWIPPQYRSKRGQSNQQEDKGKIKGKEDKECSAMNWIRTSFSWQILYVETILTVL